MSHEGDGMKLRDLAKASRNPTSFMPAFHIFRFRLSNWETSRLSRRSYESVPRLSPTLRLLTLLQQTTMVHILGILRRPCHPGSAITLLIRTDHGDKNFRRCAYHRLAFKFSLLTPDQNQRNAYRGCWLTESERANTVLDSAMRGTLIKCIFYSISTSSSM